jgi:alpha-ketoglutarate-dependent taurine dioxygenase
MRESSNASATSVTYTGVHVRRLRDDERRVPAGAPETPLVIEPAGDRRAAFLNGFLGAFSSQILADVATHGAVLLRGFDLATPQAFERAMLALDGMRALDDVFMAEAGRTVVPGTRYVLYTNANFKTGGTLEQPVFHHENYYVPDVPRYVTFFCLKPSWFGGETGVVNLAHAYNDLPAGLRERLEHEALAVRQYPLREIAARYQRPLPETHDFCARVGLPIVSRDGEQFVVIYKPSVIEHPTTHERALAINLSGELARLDLARHLAQAFAADYAGPAWSLHRFHWKHPSAINYAQLVGGLFTKPRRAGPRLYGALRRSFRKSVPSAAPRATPASARVGDLFTEAEVRILAKAMRRHYASFLWKPGDVFLIDNVKMAHAGMPGFGPRHLQALIGTCLALPLAPGTPGLCAPRPEDVRECLGAQLVSDGQATISRRAEPPVGR